MGERIFTREDAKGIIRTTTEKIKLPSDFTVIGKGSLAGFSQVKDLTIPEGVKRICTHAFFMRVFKGKSSLERLTIPASLQDFELWSFFDCNALKTIILPEGFDEKKAMELFFHCPEATLTFGKKLLFGSKAKTVQQVMDETSGILSLGGASLLTISKDDELVIPTSYQYILPHAMRNLGTRGIKRLVLHPKMRIISPKAFSYLQTLEEVVIADGTEYIDNYAFADCKKLRSIVIPDSVKRIGAGAFMNLPALESIRLPEGLTEISDEMLSGCTALKSITFGNRITHVGAGAFNDCASLTELQLPESVRTVGVGAFWNCSSLTRLAIPSGAESLSQSSIGNCPSLRTLYIPHIIHDALEQERVFGDKTSPEIVWLEQGQPLPDWSGEDISAAGSEDIMAAVSALTGGNTANTAAVNIPNMAAPSGPVVAGVDARTVQQMQLTIAAMQTQLTELSKRAAENGAAADGPDAQQIETLNRNLAKMQQRFDAVNGLGDSAEAVTALQQQAESLAHMQSRVDQLTEMQQNVQSRVEQISASQAQQQGTVSGADAEKTAAAIEDIQQKLEAIEDIQQKVGAIDEIQQKVGAIDEIQQKVEAIDEIQQKVDAISDVQERVSVIPELQQRVEEISDLQTKIGSIPDMQGAAEAISGLQNTAEAISDIQQKVEVIADVRERVDAIAEVQENVIPELQQRVDAIAEAQANQPQQTAAPVQAPAPVSVQAAIPAPAEASQTAPPAAPAPAVPEEDIYSEKLLLARVHLGKYDAAERVFTHEISKPMPGPKERSAALKDYTVIAYRSFRGAEGGERFEIPEGVRRVEQQAFWDSPRLLMIEIPNSLTEIEPDAFSGCTRLTDVFVKEGEPERLIVEAFLFRPDAKVHWPKKGVFSKARIATVAELIEQFDDILTEQKAKKLTVRSHVLRIPEGYTMIAPGALQHINPRVDEPEHALKTVFLPRSMRRIAAKAFTGLEHVSHIVIPDGLEFIDMNAFTGCVGPFRLVLPDSVSYIGPYAFAAPCQFEQIRLPGKLRSLPENALTNCNTVVTLRIPESVEQIGECALSGCTGLTGLAISRRFETQLPAILDGPVKLNVTWLEDDGKAYQQTPSQDFLAVTDPSFGPAAEQRLFTKEISAACANFAERLAMLRTHPVIAPFALSEMANQTKFEIPLGVLRLCSYAFGNNTRLFTLTVPKALNEFEFGAFYGCQNLRDVFLPEGFERSCAAALFMRRPHILVTIGNARSVRVRQLTAECPWILSAGDAADLALENGTLSIPEGYRVIASYVYHGIMGFNGLRRIHVPSTGRILGSYSFVQLPELEEVVCEEGLLAVEPQAFVDCPALKRIVLPSTLKFLGVLPFEGCVQLESITLPKRFAERAADILRDCPHAQITWIDDTVAAVPEAEAPATVAEKAAAMQNVADAIFDTVSPEENLPDGSDLFTEDSDAMRNVAEQIFASDTPGTQAVPEVAEPESPAVPLDEIADIPDAPEVEEPEAPAVTLDEIADIPAVPEVAEPEIPAVTLDEIADIPAVPEVAGPETPAVTLDEIADIPEVPEVEEPETPAVTLDEIADIPTVPEVEEPEVPAVTLDEIADIPAVPEAAEPETPAVTLDEIADIPTVPEVEEPETPAVTLDENAEIPAVPEVEEPGTPAVTLDEIADIPAAPEVEEPEAPAVTLDEITDIPAVPEVEEPEAPAVTLDEIADVPAAPEVEEPEAPAVTLDEIADIPAVPEVEEPEAPAVTLEEVEPSLYDEEPDSVECGDLHDLSAIEPISSAAVTPEEIGRTEDDSEELQDIRELSAMDETASAPILEEMVADQPSVPILSAIEEEPAPSLPAVTLADLSEEPAIGEIPAQAAAILEDIGPAEPAPAPQVQEESADIVEKMNLASSLGITLDSDDLVQIMTEEPPEWPVHVEDFGSRIEPGMLPEAGLPIPKDGRFTIKERRARYHKEPEFAIPSGFTDIRAGACAGLDDLEKLILPDTVTHIGSGAFSDCASLVEVNIPRSVKAIADDAFEGCESLTTVTMPRELENMAQTLFSPLVHIIWIEPEKPRIIGDGRFTAKIRRSVYDDSDTLEIPEGYTDIRAGACAGLDELVHVKLPSTLTKISAGAFADCTALTELVIPAGVTELEEDAFEGCSALKTVTVPKALEADAKACFPDAEIIIAE